MQDQNFLNSEERDYEKPIIRTLGILTIISVLAFSWYFYKQYTEVVSTIDSSVFGLIDVERMQTSLKTKRSFKAQMGNKLVCPAWEISRGSNAEGVPTVLYLKQSIENSGSGDNTYELVRKAGNFDLEVLTKLSIGSEFPTLFEMDNQKNQVAINTGNKVQIFDLVTKQSHHISFAQRKIHAATFSPDGTKLFIVLESTETGKVGNVFFMIYNFDDCTSETVYEGIHAGMLTEAVWRSDDTIVLKNLIPPDEYSAFDQYDAYLFDLSDRSIKHLAVRNPILSPQGTYMAVVQQSVDHSCSEALNSSPGTFSMINPRNEVSIKTVGSASELVRILAFSGDESSILFATKKPVDNYEDCGREVSQETYYTQSIQTGEKTKVSNIAQVLKEWKAEYVGAEVVYEDDGVQALMINNTRILTTTLPLFIVAQYHR